MKGKLNDYICKIRKIIEGFNALFQVIVVRLEKLCPPDGRKVRMKMEESVASFQLNSSLVPGNIFNCHLELVLDNSDSGMKLMTDGNKNPLNQQF